MEARLSILEQRVNTLTIGNTSLRADNASLRADNASLRADNAVLHARLDIVEDRLSRMEHSYAKPILSTLFEVYIRRALNVHTRNGISSVISNTRSDTIRERTGLTVTTIRNAFSVINSDPNARNGIVHNRYRSQRITRTCVLTYHDRYPDADMCTRALEIVSQTNLSNSQRNALMRVYNMCAREL